MYNRRKGKKKLNWVLSSFRELRPQRHVATPKSEETGEYKELEPRLNQITWTETTGLW